MLPWPLAVALLLTVLASGPALGAEPRASRLAPLDSEALSTHTPFLTGDCSVCHEKAGGAGPGRLARAVNEICFDCHDEFKGNVARRMRHPAPKDDCTKCHNPHNSAKRKLLL